MLPVPFPETLIATEEDAACFFMIVAMGEENQTLASLFT
jgi:hypothetical protein